MRLPSLAVAFLAAVPFAHAVPEPAKHQKPAPEKEIHREPDNREAPPEGYGPEAYHRIDENYVCAKFDGFAKEAEFIFNLVSVLECGDDECWEPVRKGIYELEYGVDLVDTDLDNSDRSYIWQCPQEAAIANCFENYANVLIRALNLLRDRTRYIDYRTAKFINIAINSLRAADYVLVYELARRMHCEKHQVTIMRKHGAIDGSTPDSVREAFAEFVFTPLITGDDFQDYSEEGDDDHDNYHHGRPEAHGQQWHSGYHGEPYEPPQQHRPHYKPAGNSPSQGSSQTPSGKPGA